MGYCGYIYQTPPSVSFCEYCPERCSDLELGELSA